MSRHYSGTGVRVGSGGKRNTPKPDYKKIKPNILKEKIILKLFDYKKHPFKKEWLAKEFEVKTSEIEKILRQMNIEGYVSQSLHECHAHDTQRNLMFPGPSTGWTGDWYYILRWPERKAGSSFMENFILCETTKIFGDNFLDNCIEIYPVRY